MLGRTDSRARLAFLLVVFVLCASTLVARLGWWQVAQRDRLAEAAHRQIFVRLEVPSRRGEIYDRSGTVVLAGTVTRDRLVVAADKMSAADRERMVSLLTDTLQLDDAAAVAVRTKLETKRPYLVLVGDLAPDTADTIKAAAAERGITGLSFESEAVRTYPQAGGGPGTSLLAAQLGFVNREGQGQYGVEQYYQDTLAGTPRIVEADKDANGQPITDTEHTVQAGTPGSDLRLTIDAGLQLAVEQEVMTAWAADGAEGVSAVVMDPYTGEIYASADYPSYDANDYRSIAATDPGRFLDPSISAVYEPGSVFKMLTAIAGLETGTVTMDKEFVDSGTLKLDGGKTKIDDADHKPLGLMQFQDGIAKSRNVVAAKAALGLSPSLAEASTILHSVWMKFGFGAKTGVDLAGEVSGIVNDPSISAWREIDLANGSFGQGVAVTQMQLAASFAAMINGGDLVTPHIVGAIDGHQVPVQSRPVMDPSLSPQLADLMNHVVTSVPYYAGRTLIPGYWVGGKTGTAQIWDAQANAWKSRTFNFSFIGYIGRQVGHPDLVVAVWIHEGKPKMWNLGQLEMPIMSFQLFRRIATDAITTPGLLPEPPAQEAPLARVRT